MLKYAHGPAARRRLSEQRTSWHSNSVFKNEDNISQPASLTHFETAEVQNRRAQSVSRMSNARNTSSVTSSITISTPSCSSPSSLDSSSSAYSSLAEQEDSSSNEARNHVAPGMPCNNVLPTKIIRDDLVLSKRSSKIDRKSRRSDPFSNLSCEDYVNDDKCISDELSVKKLASLFEKASTRSLSSPNYSDKREMNKLSTRFSNVEKKDFPVSENENSIFSDSVPSKVPNEVKTKKSVVIFTNNKINSRLKRDTESDDLTYTNVDDISSRRLLDRSMSKSMRNGATKGTDECALRSEHFKRSMLAKSFHWRNTDAKPTIKTDSNHTKSSETSKLSCSILKTKSLIRVSFRKSLSKTKDKTLPNGSELQIKNVQNSRNLQEKNNCFNAKASNVSKDSNNNRNAAQNNLNASKREVCAPNGQSISISSGMESSLSVSSAMRKSRKCFENSKNRENVPKNIPARHKSESPTRLPSGYHQASENSPVHKRTCSLVSAAPDDKKMPVRVWVKCLLQEMEYKTVHVLPDTTASELVHLLLSKFKMKHRDPNLFYLALEVVLIKNDGPTSTTVPLSDTSRPSALLECQPCSCSSSSSRLTLKMRRGGLLKVHDEELAQGSQYKSLLVSERSDCVQVISLVLACNNLKDASPSDYVLVQVTISTGMEVRLLPHDRPLPIVQSWPTKDHAKIFIRLSKLRINNSLRSLSTDHLTKKLAESSVSQKVEDVKTPKEVRRSQPARLSRSIPDVVSNNGRESRNPADKSDLESSSNRQIPTSPKSSNPDPPSGISVSIINQKRHGRMLPQTPRGSSSKTKYNTSINTNLLYHTYTNFEFLEKAGLTKSYSHGYCDPSSAKGSGDSPPPVPPVRAPRIPLRRQGVKSAGPDLLAETDPEQNLDQEGDGKKRVLSYNDYENYFYI